MKKTFVISFIILILSNIGFGYGQVCGKFIDDALEAPLIKVYFEMNSYDFVRSDVNGEFELEISENLTKSDLYFETLSGLIVRIKDVPLNSKQQLNLGTIYLPEFKYISLDDYKNLTKTQQKECIEDRHYADVYGYLYSNELENKNLILNCVDLRRKITEFVFDPRTKIISVDWKTFKNCG